VVVLGNRIVSTGYNGTPEGMTNCSQGGCYRCAHPDLYELAVRLATSLTVQFSDELAEPPNPPI
jgi:deoxycytidylate deaminase